MSGAVEQWIFTFGSGHYLYSRYRGDRGEFGDRDGIPLADRFVRLPGSLDEARAEMVRIFGTCWCDQYTATEGAVQIAKYGLAELVL